MSVIGKMYAAMIGVAKEMKTGVDNCKLDTKIAAEEKTIKRLTVEITNLVINRLEAGDEMSAEIMERYNSIVEIRERINALEKEKMVSKKICSNCGAKNLVDMDYCGKCGKKLVQDEVTLKKR